MAEVTNTWEAIREGTNDVERLIGQKQYNLAMMKARQTLEIMVRTLSERNGIQLTDMASNIDDLYERRIISQTTAEHYHKIRMIGNKAAHEGDENPSGANTAYHLLSQELYTFAKDYAPSNSARRARTSASYSSSGSQNSSAGRSSGSGYSGSGYGGSGYSSSNSGSGSGSRSSAGGSGSGSGSTSSSRNREIDERSVRRASHRTSKKSSITPELVFKVMVPILVIVIVIGAIAFFKKQKETQQEEETQQELQIVVETTAPETEPVTLPPETEPETVMVYTVNTDVLNVRSAPSTDSEKLGKVRKGETLSYISDYDDEWALINYNDQEGYVSKQYVDVRSVETSELEAEAAAAEALGAEGAQGEEAADGE